MLKEIYDPPKILYTVGNKKLLEDENCIAIVGCRKHTAYGEKAANYFSYNLAKQGFTIISGLARGIDSLAHKGALDANGKTIAVIGSGLDLIYPKENVKLAKEIVRREGLIVSEYPLGTRPNKMNFPARNRIISGLSKVLLVIEATERSGSLITVDFALEQGRDVYAIPGNISENNSTGTNQLIKDGAKLIMNYKDVIKENQKI